MTFTEEVLAARKPRAAVVMTPTTRSLLGFSWQGIRARLEEDLDVATVVEATDPDEVRRHLDAFSPELVVAAGGDGTVNLVLESGASFTVLPLGTANDLSRWMSRNPAPSRRIDVLRVNERRFCTTGGLGIPALIAERVNHLREGRYQAFFRNLGTPIYTLVSVDRVLRAMPYHELTVQWVEPDSTRIERMKTRTHGLFVTNQDRFAGTMRVAPDARNDDGVFEIGLLRPRGRRGILAVLARLAAGLPPRPSDVTLLRATRARIETRTPACFFGDGEVLEPAGKMFDLRIEPGAVTVVDPLGAEMRDGQPPSAPS